MNHTVIPSAPADDAISQTQIALNNMMDQVRETYLYLLELAPAIDKSGALTEPPKEQLDKWRNFRSEFEASWRLGEKLSVPPLPTAPADAEEQDLQTRTMNDALFRAQRLITIAQCIRQQIGLLPRTPPSVQSITEWKEKNDKLNAVLGSHVESVSELSRAVRRTINQISADALI